MKTILRRPGIWFALTALIGATGCSTMNLAGLSTSVRKPATYVIMLESEGGPVPQDVLLQVRDEVIRNRIPPSWRLATRDTKPTYVLRGRLRATGTQKGLHSRSYIWADYAYTDTVLKGDAFDYAYDGIDFLDPFAWSGAFLAGWGGDGWWLNAFIQPVAFCPPPRIPSPLKCPIAPGHPPPGVACPPPGYVVCPPPVWHRMPEWTAHASNPGGNWRSYVGGGYAGYRGDSGSNRSRGSEAGSSSYASNSSSGSSSGSSGSSSSSSSSGSSGSSFSSGGSSGSFASAPSAPGSAATTTLR